MLRNVNLKNSKIWETANFALRYLILNLPSPHQRIDYSSTKMRLLFKNFPPKLAKISEKTPVGSTFLDIEEIW